MYMDSQELQLDPNLNVEEFPKDEVVAEPGCRFKIGASGRAVGSAQDQTRDNSGVIRPMKVGA